MSSRKHEEEDEEEEEPKRRKDNAIVLNFTKTAPVQYNNFFELPHQIQIYVLSFLDPLELLRLHAQLISKGARQAGRIQKVRERGIECY